MFHYLHLLAADAPGVWAGPSSTILPPAPGPVVTWGLPRRLSCDPLSPSACPQLGPLFKICSPEFISLLSPGPPPPPRGLSFCKARRDSCPQGEACLNPGASQGRLPACPPGAQADSARGHLHAGRTQERQRTEVRTPTPALLCASGGRRKEGRRHPGSGLGAPGALAPGR